MTLDFYLSKRSLLYKWVFALALIIVMLRKD